MAMVSANFLFYYPFSLIFFVSKDVIRLRTQHRIVGNLAGALPLFPRQPNNHGLPLMLMPEEVRLLSYKSIITIVEEADDLSHFKSPHCKSFYANLQTEQDNEINSQHRTARIAEIDYNLDKIVAGKLKKTEQNFNNSPEELAKFRENIRSQLLATIKDMPKNSDNYGHTSIPISRFHIETPYSNIPHREYHLSPLAPFTLEAIKFHVFQDFWHKGYYLSDGIKFGGHFLAYDHDPIAFHAKYIIICSLQDFSNSLLLDHFEKTLLQAYGRLGKNVRKNVIIVHYENLPKTAESPVTSNLAIDKPIISYKHIQWNRTDLS